MSEYRLYHNNGRFSRWTVNGINDNRVKVEVLSYDANGYYMAQASNDYILTETDFENNLRAIMRIPEIRIVEDLA